MKTGLSECQLIQGFEEARKLSKVPHFEPREGKSGRASEKPSEASRSLARARKSTNLSILIDSCEFDNLAVKLDFAIVTYLRPRRLPSNSTSLCRTALISFLIAGWTRKANKLPEQACGSENNPPHVGHPEVD